MGNARPAGVVTKQANIFQMLVYMSKNHTHLLALYLYESNKNDIDLKEWHRSMFVDIHCLCLILLRYKQQPALCVEAKYDKAIWNAGALGLTKIEDRGICLCFNRSASDGHHKLEPIFWALQKLYGRQLTLKARDSVREIYFVLRPLWLLHITHYHPN